MSPKQKNVESPICVIQYRHVHQELCASIVSKVIGKYTTGLKQKRRQNRIKFVVPTRA